MRDVYEDRLRSGDLTSDITGHVLIILHGFVALCLVEVINRSFDPIAFLAGQGINLWDGLAYAIAFVVVFSGLVSASERWLGGRLDSLQSTMTRLLPAGPRINAGYERVLRRLGWKENSRSWPPKAVPFVIYFLVISANTILISHLDGREGGEAHWFAVVLIGFVGVHLTLTLSIAVASVAVSRRLDRRRDQPPRV